MESFAITDIGVKRQVNQDYIYYVENSIGSFPNLFIVADGMGGHKAGDYASRTCVDCVADSIKNSQRKHQSVFLKKPLTMQTDRF